MFLFNDLLIYAKLLKKDKYKYKERMYLDAVRLIDVIDREGMHRSIITYELLFDGRLKLIIIIIILPKHSFLSSF